MWTSGTRRTLLLAIVVTVAVALAVPHPPVARAAPSYDVVVVGEGPGAVAAAVHARRAGARVGLFPQSDWLGGQASAAGVSTMDESYRWTSPPTSIEGPSGLWKEVVDRLVRQAGGDPAALVKCLYLTVGVCPDPRLVKETLEDLVRDEQARGVLDVHYLSAPTGCLRAGGTVTGVTVREGANGVSRTYAAAVVIDATELGDLMPLCGVPYRLGAGTAPDIDPADRLQDITWTAVLRRYDGGIPAALRLAQDPPGYADYLPGFRAKVAGDGPWTDNYATPKTALQEHAYRGMFDPTRPSRANAATPAGAAQLTLAGVNFANDTPFLARDVEDPAARRRAFCGALARTLAFIRYEQTELGQPWSLDERQGYQQSRYRSAKDCPELAAFQPFIDRLPLYPYIRQGRILVGVETLTSPAIAAQKLADPRDDAALRAVSFADAVAVGGYDFDLHNHGRLDTRLDDPADLGAPHAPFQMALGALIPATVDGFLVAEKGVSQGQIVNGATRLQPIAFLIGQAAGELAAQAALAGIAPRQVPALLVQRALVGAGSRLALAEYADVSRATPGWGAIQLASLHGLMAGTVGAFAPEAAATGGEVAQALARLLGIAGDGSGADALAQLQARGLVRDGELAMDAPARQGDLALVLARGLGADPDDGAVAGRWLQDVGVGAGCPAYACLGDPVARWQLAVVAADALVLVRVAGGGAGHAPLVAGHTASVAWHRATPRPSDPPAARRPWDVPAHYPSNVLTESPVRAVPLAVARSSAPTVTCAAADGAGPCPPVLADYSIQG